MNNLIVNGHLFVINILNGEIFFALKKNNNKLSIPKISYSGKDSIDKNIKTYLNEELTISVINMSSCHIYSKNNIIDIIYVVFTKDTKLNAGYKYFKLDELDSKLVSEDVINYLKENLKKMSLMKQLCDEYFSLKELQNIFEKLYKIEIDRRNFRKRLINLKIVSETDDTRKKVGNGRPNKLYKFNEVFDVNLI